MSDDSEGARAVVEAPEQRSRCEGAGDEALVAVDVRGEQCREFARVGEETGEELIERFGEMVLLVAREDRLILRVAQREVDVTGVSFSLVVLGHEREADALLGRDLLGAQFEETVFVGLLDQGVVLKGHLVLAEVAFALDRLDDHAGITHRATDPSEERFDPRGSLN